MAKKKEENQPSLFDDLALENNLDQTQTNPLEKKDFTKDLIKTIKEKILEFDDLCPIHSVIRGSILGTSFNYCKLMDGQFKLSIAHGYMFFNSRTQMIQANDNFGIQCSLYENKNHLYIDSFKINYTKKKDKEFYAKEDLKETSLDEKDLNDKLNILKSKLENYFKGENHVELTSSKKTDSREAGENLQQTSHIQPLSMGHAQSIESRSLKDSMPTQTKGAEFTKRPYDNEAGGDERRSEEISPHRDENYRLSNETRDRERAYHQACEKLAKNSLNEDKNEANFAKTSQNFLSSAKFVDEFQQALLELYLANKSQKELEYFYKIKNIYSSFSPKFRQKDAHTKLEDKYQSQKDKLNEEQKEKMLNDFMLALSTNTNLNLSEQTGAFLALNLFEKLSKLKEGNEDLEKNFKNLEKLGKEFMMRVKEAKPDLDLSTLYTYKKKMKK